MIEGINVCKSYKDGHSRHEVLKNVNFQLKEGDSTAIVGKSGSGKSTLLHLLACLDSPTSGKVLHNGSNFVDLSKRDRNRLRNENFGFIFQHFFLNGRDSVFDNVALPLVIRGLSTGEICRKTLNALEEVGLVEKRKNAACNLSGGEQQRVCIARALVGDPKIIFADEPTGNLDSFNSSIIESLLLALPREKQATLVVVTHDADLAAQCNHVLKMRDGHLEDMILRDPAGVLEQLSITCSI